MIQCRAKNRLWQAGRRWRTTRYLTNSFSELNFEYYDYIIGDKIYTEPSEEAKEAFRTVQMWKQLKA